MINYFLTFLPQIIYQRHTFDSSIGKSRQRSVKSPVLNLRLVFGGHSSQIDSPPRAFIRPWVSGHRFTRPCADPSPFASSSSPAGRVPGRAEYGRRDAGGTDRLQGRREATLLQGQPSMAHDKGKRQPPLAHATGKRQSPLAHATGKRQPPLAHATGKRRLPLAHATGKR